MRYAKIPETFLTGTLSSRAIRVGLAYAFESNFRTGEFRGTSASVAKRAGVSAATAYRGITELREAGFIEKRDGSEFFTASADLRTAFSSVKPDRSELKTDTSIKHKKIIITERVGVEDLNSVFAAFNGSGSKPASDWVRKLWSQAIEEHLAEGVPLKDLCRAASVARTSAADMEARGINRPFGAPATILAHGLKKLAVGSPKSTAKNIGRERIRRRLEREKNHAES